MAIKIHETEAIRVNSAEDKCHSTVPECFHKPLMKVAYKLLSRDKATFVELRTSEHQLWNSFETDQIYRLLTGKPDTVLEFRFNWYMVTSADGTAEFIPDQAPPGKARVTMAVRSRPLLTVPEPKVKLP